MAVSVGSNPIRSIFEFETDKDIKNYILETVTNEESGNMKNISNQKYVSKEGRCVLCKSDLINFRYTAMTDWNISGYICGKCYGQKLAEYYLSSKDRHH